jgi:hypothetical protein
MKKKDDINIGCCGFAVSKQKYFQSKKDRYGSFKPTAEVSEAWNRTRKFARQLEATVVLFQFRELTGL